MTISPYVCRISNATFSHPCTVKSCMAHIENFNSSGVNAAAITNCTHVDFELAGFSESLDYAVLEQGFVGFRDLQYMSSFLRVNAIALRDLYTGNVDLIKKAISLIWAVKNNLALNHCELCGHPVPDGYIRCVSATICDDRKETVHEIASPFLPALSAEEIVKAYNIIWRSLTEKFTPGISLSENEIASLQELRVNI